MHEEEIAAGWRKFKGLSKCTKPAIKMGAYTFDLWDIIFLFFARARFSQ
jgi:hypothetical protein